MSLIVVLLIVAHCATVIVADAYWVDVTRPHQEKTQLSYSSCEVCDEAHREFECYTASERSAEHAYCRCYFQWSSSTYEWSCRGVEIGCSVCNRHRDRHLCAYVSGNQMVLQRCTLHWFSFEWSQTSRWEIPSKTSLVLLLILH